MRALIRWFDGLLSRANGVFVFHDDAECIFRLGLGRAPHDIPLSGGTTVRRGDPVLMLHLWNEHIPPMDRRGSDVAWAARFRRTLMYSLRAMVNWLADHPELADRRVLGGPTVLVARSGEGGSAHLVRRLGFDLYPYHSPLGRFGEFWDNLYVWALMWTYNRGSINGKSALRLRRTEIWMPTALLFSKFHRGPAQSDASPRNERRDWLQ